MSFARIGLFAALSSVTPIYGAVAAELLNTGPVCTTPEAVVPGRAAWLRQDWEALQRLGCESYLRDELRIVVIRCGIRGSTPEQEDWVQFYYPIETDPTLPYRVCEIEASIRYQGTKRFFTRFLNIRLRGWREEYSPPAKRGAPSKSEAGTTWPETGVDPTRPPP